MTVVVTGASGFVGQCLCPVLEAAGMTVRRAGRNVTGDIGDKTDWGPILEGASTVIHLAARVHVVRPTEQKLTSDEHYYSVNAIGSEHLARAAAQASVRRLIFLSTAKVMGEFSTRPLTAADPVNPQNSYARSKLEAERAITAVAGAMELVILRPPLVYGPHVKGNFLRLMKVIESSIPLPFGAVTNQRSLIFVSNLVEAIKHALKVPAGVYLPTDGEDLSTPDLIRHLASAMDNPIRLISIPPTLLNIGTYLIKRNEEFQKLAGSLQLDGKLPGWKPAISVRDGLKSTANWFVEARKHETVN